MGNAALMRALAASGAWLCAFAVMLSAYAAHAADGLAQSRLQTAALFAFVHGLALLVLAPRSASRGMRFGIAVLLAGVLLFSGSLAAEALFALRPRLAPFGGTLLIVGWLWLGAVLLRKREG
jgi:uncharacterized membrane protein YgdD (TMEM256/DUF423 family)